MEQKLWILALILALLNPQLHVFQDWFKENGALETEKYNSMQIKLSTAFHPPVGASGTQKPHSY